MTTPTAARTALLAVILHASLLAQASAPPPIYLEQNWSPELRELFYFTPQGSRLIPYDWFLALERYDDKNLFSAPANLARFGWLYHSGPSSKLNPGNLPIGFTLEPAAAPAGGKWMGMTCAACHTANLSHKGKVLRIDGGPATADFGLFLSALSRSVLANHPSVDKEKFERFVTRLRATDPAGTTLPPTEKLADLYQTFAAEFIGRAWMRTAPIQPGPGRVDALTQIINSLAVFNLGLPENLHPPMAPTSYPFLWLTPKLDFVQWNPIASSPIARNSGEALGVFGEANFGRNAAASALDSTILFDRLYELEKWVEDLKPPKWQDDIFGSIDKSKWTRGAALFQQNCRSCHNMPPFDMTRKEDNIHGDQFIKITRVNYETVGTDPLYVQSLVGRFVQTGSLSHLFNKRTVVPAAEFFAVSTGAVLRKGMLDNKITGEKLLQYNGYRFFPKKNPADDAEQLRPYRPASFTDMKAGPLLGIWATGPFLHNGSVANVYDLLSPPEERLKTFWVGNQELDTARLGFVSTEREGLFKFDTTLPGNRNAGHAFPQKPLTPKQRLDVIEFLKDPERYPAVAVQVTP